jgi:hypothetical protein
LSASEQLFNAEHQCTFYDRKFNVEVKPFLQYLIRRSKQKKTAPVEASKGAAAGNKAAAKPSPQAKTSVKEVASPTRVNGKLLPVPVVKPAGKDSAT